MAEWDLDHGPVLYNQYCIHLLKKADYCTVPYPCIFTAMLTESELILNA